MDRFGAFAGSLCALHCALCALLPSLFAALGVGFLLSPGVEWGLTLLAVGVAATALVVGWRKHRSVAVAALLSVAILGLLGSRVMEELGGDHHGDEHAAEHHEEHGEEHGEGHEAGVAEEHGEEHGHEDGHGLGAAVGVLAGLLLVPGHLLNLRETRACDADCDDDC